jgi:hypothetical protein
LVVITCHRCRSRKPTRSRTTRRQVTTLPKGRSLGLSLTMDVWEMRDNFWCFWDEFTTQNFRLHLRFPTLSLREMLCTNPPCAEKHCHFMPSIYFFFRVSLFGVYVTGFLHIWSIPCMLCIGLGVFLLFLVSDRTF